MRKAILIVVAVLLSFGAYAQKAKFGVKAGYNLSNISGFSETKNSHGYLAGIVVEKQINSLVTIQAELLYSKGGSKLTYINNDPEIKLGYVNLPIIAKVYLAGGFNIHVGPQFGYMTDAKYKSSSHSGESIYDQFDHFNFSLVSGLGYDFCCGIFTEARYNVGLTDLNLSGFSKKLKYGNLNFSVGYKF